MISVRSKKVIADLANGETLEAKYRDHLLTETTADIENVIFNLIGCLYIR